MNISSKRAKNWGMNSPSTLIWEEAKMFWDSVRSTPTSGSQYRSETRCIGWTVSTIGRGVRSSSATGYLAPEYLSRPNLHVLVHAQVTKLIQTGTRNRLPSFHSLQFTSTLAGPRGRSCRLFHMQAPTHDDYSPPYHRHW